MKQFFVGVVLAVAAAPAVAADVGVSISVGQPGFYGRIDIGNFPPPVLVYPRPVIIEPMPVGVVRQPIYVHVPPGQAKNWRKHCRRYNACGRPVYFVQDRWYNDIYVPAYRERRHEHRRDDARRPGKGRGNGQDHKNK